MRTRLQEQERLRRQWGGARLATTLLCCVLMSGAAHAAPPNAKTPAPEALYETGKEALKAGEANEALVHFKAALEGAEAASDLGLTWQLLMAVAYTYREAQEPGFAIEYYRRFLDSTELHQAALTAKWRKRRELAERDIAELERTANETHGYVTVASSPAGANIVIDGSPAGADGDRVTPFGLYLTPGDHVVTVAIKGYKPAQTTITIAAGKLKPLAFTLKPITLEVDPAEPSGGASTSLPEEPASVTPTVTATLSDSDDALQTYGPWSVMGTGGATLVTAVILTAISESEKAELETMVLSGRTDDAVADWQRRSDDADTLGHTAIALYAVSAAALTGGILWMVTPEEPGELPTNASLHLTPTRGGVMTGATWRF